MAARYQRLTQSNCYKFSTTSENMKELVNGAVKEVTAGSRSKVFLLWSESTLVLVNFPREVEEILQFTEKKMTKEMSGRRMVTKFSFETAKPFSTYLYEGVYILRTLQGYWRRIFRWALKNGLDVELRDLRSEDMIAAPKFDLMGGFRFNQKEFTEDGLSMGCSGMFSACTRYGKCFARGTEILMFDGTRRRVETIREGELVMGHDSTPRNVTGCVTGKDRMIKITPNKEEPFVVTQDHVLVLSKTFQSGKVRLRSKGAGKGYREVRYNTAQDGKEILITASEYMGKSDSFKHLHKLVKRAVTYSSRDILVDPYCYGLWLGDGTTGEAHLTTAHLRYLIREFGKEEIHPDYLINSEEVRLELLAGLIDSAGYPNNGKAYAITGKDEHLMRDVQTLARSLGFRSQLYPKVRSAHAEHKATYYEVHISGNVTKIPVRLERKKLTGLTGRVNPLTTGFKAEEAGEAEYFGFSVDGPDKLFLMADFTVTHNSTVIRNILKAFPNTTAALVAPGVSLLKQTRDELREMLPDREVKMIGGGSTVKYPSKDVNIVSMDSLHKLDAGETRLLIVDEPHAVVSAGRILGLDRFELARKYAVGATLDGRYDGRDALLEGLFGPVLSQVTYKEAVAMGAVCQIKVAMVKVPVPREDGNREKAFRKFVLMNQRIHSICASLSNQYIPQEDQSLFFISQEKQAIAMQSVIGAEIPIVMDKLLSAKAREEITRQVADNERKRVICSNIFVQGVTFHDIRYLINGSGGGPSTSAIQRPGRLAEIRPDKKFGVMIDFKPIVNTKDKPRLGEDKNGKEASNLKGVQAIAREARQRQEVYESIGYIVEEIEPEELGQWIADNNTHG